MSICKNCKHYTGDCGHHFVDNVGHTDYDCYSESACTKTGDCMYFESNDIISSGGFGHIDELTIYKLIPYKLIPDNGVPSVTLHQFRSWQHRLNSDGSYDITLHGGVIKNE